LVEETGLTRKNIVEILRGVDAEIFAQLANNPEEFITKAGKILNGVKAVTVIDHIQYHLAQKTYDTNIFTDAQLEGIENVNALRVNKNLYDYVIYDSEVEKNFVEKLDGYEKVVVYVKLPRGFFITTPLGKYTPDWAIAFREGEVKHIYFVAETKGSVESAELKNIEKAKTDCAKKHFKLISNEEVFYSIVKDYKGLTDLLNDKP
ncbi:MAG: type III restriction endonuclease subunit R, partial [Selenomonadaceae bacterium]|nr:type III restriction endonuclease subunit R [Selenomonadaceae bacterium]